MNNTIKPKRAKSVCFNCEERKIGCHAYCEKYIKEDAENQKRRAENLRRSKQEESLIITRRKIAKQN